MELLRWQEAGHGRGSRPLGVSGEQSWGAGVSCRGRWVRKGSDAVEQVLRFVLGACAKELLKASVRVTLIHVTLEPPQEEKAFCFFTHAWSCREAIASVAYSEDMNCGSCAGLRMGHGQECLGHAGKGSGAQQEAGKNDKGAQRSVSLCSDGLALAPTQQGIECPLGWCGADLFNSTQPAREPGSQEARLQLALQPF